MEDLTKLAENELHELLTKVQEELNRRELVKIAKPPAQIISVGGIASIEDMGKL
jgi:hypothetical protein